MKTHIYLIAALLVLSLPCQAAAHSTQTLPMEGHWLSADKDSVIQIQKCPHQINAYCGYITRFIPTGHALTDRSICGLRIMGGLKLDGKTLTGGWILDPEADQIYHAKARIGTTPDALVLTLHKKIKFLSVNLVWTRMGHGQPTHLPVCAP